MLFTISGTIKGILHTLFHLILKINLWSRYYYDHLQFMNEETEA